MHNNYLNVLIELGKLAKDIKYNRDRVKHIRDCTFEKEVNPEFYKKRFYKEADEREEQIIILERRMDGLLEVIKDPDQYAYILRSYDDKKRIWK